MIDTAFLAVEATLEAIAVFAQVVEQARDGRLVTGAEDLGELTSKSRDSA